MRSFCQISYVPPSLVRQPYCVALLLSVAYYDQRIVRSAEQGLGLQTRGIVVSHGFDNVVLYERVLKV